EGAQHGRRGEHHFLEPAPRAGLRPVKVITNRLVDTARNLQPSAQAAEADTYIQVDARLNQVVQLPSPIRTMLNLNPNTPTTDSVKWASGFNIAGAQAGSVTNGPILQPGCWRINGQFYAAFTGTIGINFQSFIQLVDTGAGGTLLFGLFSNMPNQQST